MTEVTEVTDTPVKRPARSPAKAPVKSPVLNTADDWFACPQCQALIYRSRLIRNLWVCPDCRYHNRLSAPQRLEQLFDPGTIEPLEAQLPAEDPLSFTDTIPYQDRLASSRQRTGLDEAVICVRGTIKGYPVIVAAMDFRFMGGSLGCAVGELITTAAEAALEERIPLVLVCASGGARMQEGVLSLMQMAKTSAALAALAEANVLRISLITDPTYGGVAASFASLGDVIIAEPGARMGFAGPRVIQQTIQQTLPAGFQTAEFLLSQGLIDDTQSRSTLRATLGKLLGAAQRNTRGSLPDDPDPLIRNPELLPRRDTATIIRMARDLHRPTTLDYAALSLDAFTELRGDRISGDCPAIVGGIGWLGTQPVMLIGHQKGHKTRDLIERHFGQASPAGHRKAARLMRLAARLSIPVVTLIDTPGADPGVASEESGQAITVAENLELMSRLPVPIVSVVTGEGGSGGALALGVADRVLMCANSVYSVISPEGCAAILWRSAAMATQAAEALQIDAASLLRRGIVDGVIPEPPSGASHETPDAAALLRAAVSATLRELLTKTPQQLIADRRSRFRGFGSPSTDQET